jgi:polysaccharide biosynthesis/export protein
MLIMKSAAMQRLFVLPILISAATAVPNLAQTTASSTAAVPPCASPDNYVLGSGDQITLVVVDLEPDFSDKTFTIDGSGYLSLPYAGRVHAAGLTTVALENNLRVSFATALRDPQIVVTVTGFRNQPVSVLGAVNNPGIRQVESGKSLFQILSLSGGLRPDAGYLVHITRLAACGSIPLPGAQTDSAAGVSTATVRVKDIMNSTRLSDNIPIFPGDTISVPKADVVYAIGSVVKSGGFMLNEHESLSALEVLSLAEGLQKTADARKAKILRLNGDSPTRMEIPVDLKMILAGKVKDIQLQASDILFVPNNNAKSAGYRTLDTISGMAGAALIYTH